MVRSGQPQTGRSLLEEGGAGPGGLARCGKTGVEPRTVAWKLRQRPQIRWRWRREACSSRWVIRRYPGLERLQVWTNLRALSFEVGWPGGWPVLLQRSHAGTRSMCVFDAPEGAPHRTSPMTSAHLATLGPSKLGLSRLQQVGVRRPPERPGLPLSPERQARPGAGDPRGVSCVRVTWTCRSGSQVLTGVSGAHRSGRGTTRFSKLIRSDEHSALACL